MMNQVAVHTVVFSREFCREPFGHLEVSIERNVTATGNIIWALWYNKIDVNPYNRVYKFDTFEEAMDQADEYIKKQVSEGWLSAETFE